MQQNRLIIGVTGITGSGTSTVSAILQSEGGFVISADKLTHELMQPGHAVYDKIVARFGDTILNESGQIDRKKLGSLVFGKPVLLKELESIIHPEVISETKRLLNKPYEFAVIDAPLLVESGIYKMCDTVWLITATNETRVARITTRDNIDAQAALKRINSRKGDDYLRPFAQLEIENNGTTEELVRRIKKELQLV